MIIYSNSIKGFHEDVRDNQIVNAIEEGFVNKMGFYDKNRAEIQSWQNSLQAMNNILDDPSEFNGECMVAIEYKIPSMAKRIDFMVFGKDKDENNNAVIVELKQWEKAEETTMQDTVKTFTGGRERNVPHPCYQAAVYAATLRYYDEGVKKENIKLIPCAFLHNFSIKQPININGEFYKRDLKMAKLFYREDYKKFRGFLNTYIKKPDGGKALTAIEKGRIRPSKSLQDALDSMIKGNQEFHLIDEQLVAFSHINAIMDKAAKDYQSNKKKSVIIVRGGPGTGKSLIAISLLVAQVKEGRDVRYVTKNATPRKVYKRKLIQGRKKGGKSSQEAEIIPMDGFFISPDNIYQNKPDSFFALLVDEAHRLTLKNRFHKGENEIAEIIRAAKVSVFFIDDDQRVTTKDIGTIDAIEDAAKEVDKEAAESGGGVIVYGGKESEKDSDDFVLRSEFRCNGSDGYLAFLNDVLGIGETANWSLEGDYDFKVFDTAQEMKEALLEKNKRNKARMVAGYDWEWVSRHDSQKQDIVLPGGFSAQWNMENNGPWAIDPNSFDQVGCIHTCQGLDFDYIGVIIGPDLCYREGKVITNSKKIAVSDRSSGIRSCKDPVLADKLIRNTYKVLMSRGMKGCYVYCVDPALRDYLKERAKKRALD